MNQRLPHWLCDIFTESLTDRDSYQHYFKHYLKFNNKQTVHAIQKKERKKIRKRKWRLFKKFKEEKGFLRSETTVLREKLTRHGNIIHRWNACEINRGEAGDRQIQLGKIAHFVH